MRGYVTRTFLQTTINSEKIEVIDGSMYTTPLAPVTVDGKITKERAIKLIRKTYKVNGNVIINISDIIENSVLLGIPVDKFREMAEEIKEATKIHEENQESPIVIG